MQDEAARIPTLLDEEQVEDVLVNLDEESREQVLNYTKIPESTLPVETDSWEALTPEARDAIAYLYL